MANINLRPWRRERRERLQKEFVVQLSAVAIAAALAGFGWFTLAKTQVKNQQNRITLIDNKLTFLDQRIAEIQSLEDEKLRLVNRMGVIENLNSNRSEPVQILQEVVLVVPKGVHINELSRQDNGFTLTGFGEQASSITSLMRNIEGSNWFKEAAIKKLSDAVNGNSDAGKVFSLEFNLEKQANEEEQ